MENYVLKCNLGMTEVANRESQRLKDDLEFIDESLADVLRPLTFAALMAIPEIVDAKSLVNGLSEVTGGKNIPVSVSDPKIQKKIYNIIGKDKYVNAVIINVIARTLMAEAVGEKSSKSFDAIASVIWNRAGGDKNKMVDVIFQPGQFSCWRKMNRFDKRNYEIKPHGSALTNPSSWRYCINTARKMVNGTFVPTVKWKQYYAHNRVTPKWASKLKESEKIGNHTFGNF